VTTTPLIQPRTLKGFRDYLPEVALPRERMMEQIRHVFRSYGYLPIDTPALEYAEILLGKGGEETDRQMYRFRDHGGRDVALRFDLTVPLARFAAEHMGQLGIPFKRYHIAPVWRGENTQRGRYREFVQCDFDFIGTQALAADAEVVLVIHDLLRALGLQRFTIRINDRHLMGGLLEEWGLLERQTSILRALDKLGRAGPHEVRAELTERVGLSEPLAERILELAATAGAPEHIVPALHKAYAGHPRIVEALDRLGQLCTLVHAAGIAPETVILDLSIARGLDYYTGTVYETYLGDLPGIGSVCSGGRYDNLASLYTRQVLPGVGASLGLDRLLAAMEELGLLERRAAAAPVLIVYFDAARLADYMRLGRQLRQAGIGAEVYPEPRKIGTQLAYADRRGYTLALIAGSDEFVRQAWQIKDLRSGKSHEVRSEDVVAAVRALLATGATT